ncbi:DUF2306 domain-containing protein [Pedobacter zeae]|uniref:DUF2306 domain-containing protein n=1 Tax=Pedobacter zeae TaxID=1737356 RepID=A0A7W6KDU4_9SPHI|nr:DUF2306 domain-containing protein [Pedobacter zeae]MBB4108737.1 hypothetical protein [Pedobacter zeae]GGH08024.1 hypothetical protein GCM10007422_25360 [Pedobacter zeae]
MKSISYKQIAWLLFFTYFFILMVQITLLYLPLSSKVSFLQIKQTEVTGIKAYLPIFYVHVYSAIFVLLAGFTQFNAKILTKYPKIHQWLGYLYVSFVLLLASPSGIFIGWFANGGLTAKTSFIILGVLWFWFTLKATLLILERKITVHKKLMYRSFALATSAITLRLWKVILVYLFHPAPMDVYQIIAWLGWIPNLLIAEWLIRKNI